MMMMPADFQQMSVLCKLAMQMADLGAYWEFPPLK